MKLKLCVPILVVFLSLPLFSQETSLTYVNGLSYMNTVLYGDTSWDHMDQFNMLTGVLISRPLEKKPEYSNRVRIAFDSPLWAQVRQLDGEVNLVQSTDDTTRYGVNFFAGFENPGFWSSELFSASVQIGPILDFQALSDSMIFSLGVEGGAEARASLSERWSVVLGLSLQYNFWGVHTVGDSTKYEIYTKRAVGIAVYPGFRYTY